MKRSEKMGENLDSRDSGQNKITRLIFRNKFSFFLLIVIAIVFVWYQFKIYSLEQKQLVQKENLINHYEHRIDSLNVGSIGLTTKVFSWAIRSELMRDNIELVNQFFREFVKQPKIMNVKFVNMEDSTIQISTDKKEESQVFENKQFLSANNLATYNDSTRIIVVNPIMGLNKKLGVLIVEIKK